MKVWEVKSPGNDVDWLGFADVTGNGKMEMLIGWTIGASAGNGLDVYEWDQDSFHKISSIGYHKLDLFHIKNDDKEDPRVKMAVWQKDTGDAYNIEIYRWIGGHLTTAQDAYPIYFTQVVDYYQQKVSEMPDAAFYWYYLADAQLKAERYTDVLETVEKGLQLNANYPEKEKFELLHAQALNWIQSNQQQEETYVYTHPEKGYSLTFPKAWEDKLVIKQHENVDELHNTNFYMNFSSSDQPREGLLFTIRIYPEEKWKEYELQGTPLNHLETKDTLSYVYQMASEHPFADREDSEEYRAYMEMIPAMKNVIQSFSLSKPVNKEVVTLEVQTIREQLAKAITKYWHVRNGGGMTDGEIKEFTFNQTPYRYLGSDIDTMEKILSYLQDTYTKEASHSFIKQAGIIEKDGRLAQPNADGGSLLNWPEALISRIQETDTSKEYEFNVPIGELAESKLVRIKWKKVDDNGWRIDSLPHF